MAQYLSDIIEDDTITCDGCNRTFNAQEITTDDWWFEWDYEVNQDCCSECKGEIKMENSFEERNQVISSALCDLYDVKNALSNEIKNQPKDADGSELTIGDCINDAIECLESLET